MQKSPDSPTDGSEAIFVLKREVQLVKDDKLKFPSVGTHYELNELHAIRCLL